MLQLIDSLTSYSETVKRWFKRSFKGIGMVKALKGLMNPITMISTSNSGVNSALTKNLSLMDQNLVLRILKRIGCCDSEDK